MPDAVGSKTWLESDGKSVTVSLTSDVDKGDIVVAEGWLGIANGSGSSGYDVSLSIDDREYQITVPSGLAVAKGAIIYIDVTDTTGHIPDDTAYSTSAGANKHAAFKATKAKDTNNMVKAIMIAKAALLS